jgi:hypothetical protein
MRITKFRSWAIASTLALTSAAVVPLIAEPAHAGSGFTRQIASGGTAVFTAGPTGVDGLQDPEIAPADGDLGPNRSGSVNLPSSSVGPGNSPHAKSNPALGTHFDALNFRQQRLANGGNQFSVEPPDQGMCVGNGFIMESVNDVLRVYGKDGTPKTGVVDLNTFYGYPAAINRTTGARGPSVTDPACYYDAETQRWFQTVLTLDTNPANGGLTGPNHLDIAVSRSADPTGSWTIYRIPVQDDGTQGTPNHNCPGGPCIGDYPHIGADANGFYITTNEYPLFADGYIGAQIYAFSKHALASGAASVGVTQIDTSVGSGHDLAGTPGFTVWPAQAPGGAPASVGLSGSEYFLSSNAAEEANGNGTSSTIGLWTLTNTASLDSASPALQLTNQLVSSVPYTIPPKANQKAGSTPLGQCVNDTTTPTPFGPGCWRFIFGAEPPHNMVETKIDSNDTRMQQVVYANGKVWGALDTGVDMGNGDVKAGIAYFIVNPGGQMHRQGYVALPHNNVAYPTISSLDNGRGVISFTVAGDDYYPSVGYAGLDPIAGAGDVQIAKAGAGPQDGFSSYPVFSARERWGDYGAAATDGKSIWFATEYTAQTCTLAQYMSAPFGSCGGTRGTLGNWATHITQVTP